VCQVGGELEPLAIAEPDVVVGVAFLQLDSLGFERGTEITECVVEKARQQQERRPLVESLLGGVRSNIYSRVQLNAYPSVLVDERTSSSGEVVLFEYRDLEPSLRKTSRSADTSGAGA
jgi:hypothetical protein